MSVIYENSANNITLADCIRLYNMHGIYVVIDDGRHVILGDEKYPLPMPFEEVE